MSDLKELAERLEVNVEKFEASMNLGLALARKVSEVIDGVIAHLREVFGEEIKEYSKK